MTNQQLKAHCEDVITNPQEHQDWVVDMARVALSSLESEPVGYTTERAATYEVWNSGSATFWDKKDLGDVAPYTAPPMPELKPIELPKPEISSAKGVLLYADDVIAAINAAGYECKVKS